MAERTSARFDIGLLRRVLGLLDRRSKRLLVLYALGSFLVSLSDVVGVAAVLPIVQVMTDAPITGYLATLNDLFGHPARSTFVVDLSVLMIAAFAVKTAFGLAMSWWGTGFTARLQLKMQRDMLSSFLSESYVQHRQRNTAEIMRATGNAANDTYTKIVGGLLSLCTEGLSVLTVMVLLLVVLPLPTLAAAAFFGISILAVDRSMARPYQRASGLYMSAAYDTSKSLIEAFQGFREVRMLNREEDFTDRFEDASGRVIQAARRMGFFQLVPKYALELIAISGIALLLCGMALSGRSGAIGSIALFVAAAIKILPSVTRISTTIGVIRSGAPGAELTLATMDELQAMRARRVALAPALPVRPGGDIVVDNIHFTFPDGDEPVLDGVSMVIPAGTTAAFCGSSGSGKTTLVDVILGLQEPQQGAIRYGGDDIADLRENWRSRIGYIPQDVFLLDDTLEANVTFGDAESERDHDRVRECIKMARLEDAIAQMPEGLQTRIGEGGTRLSGGQRQRLGIARALYHRPSIIVMDEATSALDNESEDQIIQTIESLRGQMTVIMVAHRLSTVKNVDQLFFMAKGLVAAHGTFSEVRAASPEFEGLVRLGDLSESRSRKGEAESA